MTGRYDDIIELPHPVSQTHVPMPQRDRAAQFSPFAALTGYEAVIQETSRRTQVKRIPDEQRKAELDRCFSLLKKAEEEAPEICITFFAADGRKSGGEYVTLLSQIRKVDNNKGSLLLSDGRSIAMSDVWDIESGIFDREEYTDTETEGNERDN